MAGKTVVDKVQFGNSGTPANNFLFSVDNAGGLKIQRGNDGGALTDVMTIDSNGKITSAYDIAAGQLGLTANGYAKLANGLILQWGNAVTTSGGPTAVTYPIAFPNAAFNIQMTITGGSVPATQNSIFNNSAAALNGFNAYSASGTSISFKWFAIGY